MSFYLDIDDEMAPALLDTENTGITRDLKHARTYLSNAVAIWKMIDPEKAERLQHLLIEELQPPAHQAVLRFSQEQVGQLADLLQGIETAAVGKIIDKDYHVLPHKLDYINEHAPGFAVPTTDGAGRPIYVVDQLSEIGWVRAFLETALRLGVDVIEA